MAIEKDRLETKKWLPEVILALKTGGGTGTLSQIYRRIQGKRRNLPDEWKAVIRAIIYAHSSDAKAYKQGNPDVFCNKDRGVWALRYPSEVVFGKTDYDLSVQVLASMTVEELKSFSSTGDAFWRHVNDRVAQLKQKYRIS